MFHRIGGIVRATARLAVVILLAATLGVAQATAQTSFQSDGGPDSASRATVRIISVQSVENGITYSSGTGFAVDKHHIVTNYHVVENDIENSAVVIVPSFGSAYHFGKVVYIDPRHDLALLEIKAEMPMAAIGTAELGVKMPVVALGYPGNLDRAFASSLRDLAAPSSPTSPPGAVISFRSRAIDGETIPAIIHDAQIGPGFSGGPLVNECGQVVGVNRAVPNNQAGDAQYGFSIPVHLLLQFLKGADVAPVTVSEKCVTEAERAATESAQLRSEMKKKQLEDYDRERERIDQQRATEAYMLCREDASDARLRVVLAMAVLMLLGGAGAAWAAHAGRRPLAWAAALLAFVAGSYGAYTITQPLACQRPYSAT